MNSEIKKQIIDTVAVQCTEFLNTNMNKEVVAEWDALAQEKIQDYNQELWKLIGNYGDGRYYRLHTDEQFPYRLVNSVLRATLKNSGTLSRMPNQSTIEKIIAEILPAVELHFSILSIKQS